MTSNVTPMMESCLQSFRLALDRPYLPSTSRLDEPRFQGHARDSSIAIKVRASMPQSIGIVGAGALLFMTLHKSISSVLLHESTTRVKYNIAIAVCLGEVVKMIVSILILLAQVTFFDKGQYSRDRTPEGRKNVSLLHSLFSTRGLVLFVPAALYVVQNNLYMFSAGHLSPTVFQALWQLRIVSTAIFSGTILKKKFSLGQCLSMGMLVVSIALIQIGSKPKFSSSSSEAFTDAMIGTIAMLCACALSGLAGVVLERIYTDGSTNLWVANVHLSVFSIIPALLAVAAQSRATPGQSWRAFTSDGWPWVAVALHSVGGVLVAVVTKHAGNIAKSFSGAIAISLTFIGTMLFSSRKLNWTGQAIVWTGILLLSFSTWLYLQSPPSKNPNQRAEMVETRAGGYTLVSTSSSSDQLSDRVNT